MIAHLKTTDKAAFDAALIAALDELGTIEYPENFGIVEGINSPILSGVKTDEEGNEIKFKVHLDFFNCVVLKRDENGNFIPTATDEDGNPTAFEIEEGFHVELASSVNLNFPAEIIATPEKPQYAF